MDLRWLCGGGIGRIRIRLRRQRYVTGVASGTVTIEDMAFSSPDAIAPGGSSIAALIAASPVNLRRVTLRAGNGAAGAAGADGISMANYAGVAPSGGMQLWKSTPSFMPISGGPGAINKCAQYGTSGARGGGAEHALLHVDRRIPCR